MPIKASFGAGGQVRYHLLRRLSKEPRGRQTLPTKGQRLPRQLKEKGDLVRGTSTIVIEEWATVSGDLRQEPSTSHRMTLGTELTGDMEQRHHLEQRRVRRQSWDRGQLVQGLAHGRDSINS